METSELKILIVDDNEMNRKLMYFTLRRLGCKTAEAGDGETAFEMYKNGDFNMILMDVMMPGIDGYQATRMIRQHEQQTGNHIIIIGVTGNVSAEDEAQCKESGMDHYLVKPFELEDFKKIVEKL